MRDSRLRLGFATLLFGLISLWGWTHDRAAWRAGQLRTELQAELLRQQTQPELLQQPEPLSAQARAVLPQEGEQISRWHQETRAYLRLLQAGRAEEARQAWQQRVLPCNQALFNRLPPPGSPPDRRWILLLMLGLAPLGASPRPVSEQRSLEPVAETPTFSGPVMRVLNGMLIVLSPEGRIAAVNEATCRLLGYAEAELLQQPYSLVLAGGSSLELASVRDLEAFYRRRDGTEVPVRVGTSVLGQDSKIQALVTLAENRSEAQQLQRALQHSETSLRQTLDRLIEVREEERRHFARELHDGLLQLLVGAQLQLEAAGPEMRAAAPRSLEKATAHLRQAIEEGRRIIQNLRPTALDQLGLVAALRADLENTAELLECQTKFVDGLRERQLPPALETTVFRVVGEALSNVRKHSGARQVRVLLEADQDNLFCCVEDDGAGLSPEPQAAGFGLQGMRERVELLGGELKLESLAEGGTRVAATLPLRLSPPVPSARL